MGSDQAPKSWDFLNVFFRVLVAYLHLRILIPIPFLYLAVGWECSQLVCNLNQIQNRSHGHMGVCDHRPPPPPPTPDLIPTYPLPIRPGNNPLPIRPSTPPPPPPNQTDHLPPNQTRHLPPPPPPSMYRWYASYCNAFLSSELFTLHGFRFPPQLPGKGWDGIEIWIGIGICI